MAEAMDLEHPSTGCNEFQKNLNLDKIYVRGRAPQPTAAHDRSVVRILSWNIERGHHLERSAEVIAALRPDIVCLQEVDWGNVRTGSCDVLADLAARLGMLGLFAIEFLEVPSPLRPAHLAGGGATGNALLTRLQPLEAFRVELPNVLDWQKGAEAPELRWSVRRQLRREPRVGRRSGIAAEFLVGKSRLVVCSLHLEDKAGGVQGRWSQFTGAARALEPKSQTTTTVLAGDFNTFDSPIARLITCDNAATALGKPSTMTEAAWWKSTLLPHTGYVDPFGAAAWTFRVPFVFRAKLDWIAVRRGIVADCGVGALSSSDHRPIWADLVLQKNTTDED